MLPELPGSWLVHSGLATWVAFRAVTAGITRAAGSGKLRRNRFLLRCERKLHFRTLVDAE
jgi:hypothetical protein